MTLSSDKCHLADELCKVAGLDRSGCLDRWIKTFRTPPPKHLSVQLMQRVLAHELQCRKLGGLTAATRRALRSALRSSGEARCTPAISDGAVLVREWNGRVYRVEARDDSYVLDGKAYKSLSAVAQHITGAKWSGPRFFGLTPKRST